MRIMKWVAFLFLVLGVDVGSCVVIGGVTKPVTNEDIRDAILSVVHMIRSTEDKLERHEYRERALGDQIKKALTTIDKRQRLLDPIKGTLSRLDERLAAVETILMQKDERERIQLEKTNELVEQIQQNLPKMFEKLKSDISDPKDETKSPPDKTLLKSEIEDLKKSIDSNINNISRNVVNSIEQIKADTKNNTQLITQSVRSLEDLRGQFHTCQKDKSEVLQELQKHKANFDQILTNIKTIAAKVPKLAETSDIQGVKNETLKLQKAVESLDIARVKSDLQPKIIQAVEQQRANIDQVLSNLKTVTVKLPDTLPKQDAQNEQLQDIARRISQLDGKIEDAKKTADVNDVKLQKGIDLNPKILQVVEQQKTNIDQILSNIKTLTGKILDKILQASDIQTALKPFDQMKKEVSQQIPAIMDMRKLTEQSYTKLQKSIDAVEAKSRTDRTAEILQAVEQQKINTDQVLANTKTITKKLPDNLIEPSVIEASKIETLKSLEQIRRDLLQQIATLQSQIGNSHKSIEQNNDKVQKAIEARQNMPALDQQNANIEQILQIVKKVPNRIADAADVQDARTEIEKLLEPIRNALVIQTSNLEHIRRKTENQDECKLQSSKVLQGLDTQQINFEQILRSIQTLLEQSNVSLSQDRATDLTLKAILQHSNECVSNYDSIKKELQDVHFVAEQNSANLYKTLESVKENPNLQHMILQAMEMHKTDLATIVSNMTLSPNSEASKNETMQSLQQAKDELLGQGVLLINKITALHALYEKNNEKLQKTIVESGEVAEQLNANVASSFEKLSDSVRSLSKLDQIMVQTADAVSDVKKRVEYGVHQIVVDLSTVIKKHTKELNSTVNTRFDNFELMLMEPENGAIFNLTSKISDEIDQVWRQISTMHQQMGDNTETLERIQTQTDSYINGSAVTMDSMRGKVVQITNSMAEVDDNLNYLLGRLSLVTQEFNRIKSGLGDALDQIKSSFNIVQQKIRDAGPGPHPIESNETQNPEPPPKLTNKAVIK